MPSLFQMVEASRVYRLRTAVVAKLAAEFPDVAVQAWPGKLDVSEMVEKVGIVPPAVLVAITGQRPADTLVSGVHDEPVDFTAYVVTENKPLGPQRKLYYGDEIGLALNGALLRFLETDAARWGIDDVGHPEEAKGQPVLTLKGLEKGTAFFAVTWRQTIYGQGAPRPLAAEGEVTPPPPTFIPGMPTPGEDLEVPL